VGSQVDDPTLDFDSVEFLRRWLWLAGSAPLRREILAFLRNEARLQASTLDKEKPWEPARKWVPIAEGLADTAIKHGLPAHEGAAIRRVAELTEMNGELLLMALLDACGRATYPSHLRSAPESGGGWKPGPIRVPALEADSDALARFLARHIHNSPRGWMVGQRFSAMMPMLSHLGCFRGSLFVPRT